MSTRYIRDLTGDGFEERQQKRQQLRQEQNAKLRAYNARVRALEAALARTRNAAILSAREAERAKLPITK